MRQATQILVIGGGPAGATAAGLLAREGFEVTVLERERFPRYHIGESILPSSLPILDLLGAREKIERHGFQVKRGVIFQWGPDEWSLSFNELGDDAAYAWQVVRAEFDEILLNHAAELGADVHQGRTVRELEFDGDRPVAARWADSKDAGRTGRITFGYVIDASGRGGVLANRYLKNRRFNDMFKNVAAWRYWAGAGDLAGGPEGSTGVFSVPSGWFWVIPLHDGTLSVGLVTGRDAFNERRRELGSNQAVYDEAMRQCPAVRAALDGATPVTGIRLEQDYSYTAEAFTGPGCLLAGDAACFLDPLLSTGVHLATFSGMVAAATLGSVLAGDMPEATAFTFYQKAYRRAYERMVLLVSAFYETYRGRDYHFYHAQQLSVREKNDLRLHETFLRIVAGIEDMADAKTAAYDLAVGELMAGRAVGGSPFRYRPAMSAEPIDARNAIGGVYVQLVPNLRLARAGPDVPAGGAHAGEPGGAQAGGQGSRLGTAQGAASAPAGTQGSGLAGAHGSGGSGGAGFDAAGTVSEAGLALPQDIDAERLREALGQHYDTFVAAGLAALAHGGHNRRWVQFGLAPRPGHWSAVHAGLRELAGRLLRDGVVVNFFYMGKPPGLRVRFETTPDRRDSLASSLDAEFAAWQPHLASMRRGRYEPEEHLFGGPTSMAYVHGLFTVDSQAWLAFFGLADRCSPWMFSLAMLRQMLTGLAIANWEDLGVWERIRRQTRRELPPGLDQAKVDAVAGTMRTLWTDPAALREALGVPAAGLADEYGPRFLECARNWDAGCFARGDCLIGPREAAAFATIFHWNRGAISPTTQALIAAALADRTARP